MDTIRPVISYYLGMTKMLATDLSGSKNFCLSVSTPITVPVWFCEEVCQTFSANVSPIRRKKASPRSICFYASVKLVALGRWTSIICCKSYLTLKSFDHSLSDIAYRHFFKPDWASRIWDESSTFDFSIVLESDLAGVFYDFKISSRSLIASPSPRSPILIALRNNYLAYSTELMALKYLARWKQMRPPALYSKSFIWASTITSSSGTFFEFYLDCLPSKNMRALSNAWSITNFSSLSVTA